MRYLRTVFFCFLFIESMGIPCAFSCALDPSSCEQGAGDNRFPESNSQRYRGGPIDSDRLLSYSF